jgi:hypothetical protein
MRALGAVLVAIAVTVLIAVLVYVLAVLPGQRDPLELPSHKPTPSAESLPTETASPASSPSPPPIARHISFSELVIGTCLTDAHLVIDDGSAIDSLEAIPCAAPHYEEVIALGTFADRDYPGSDSLIDELDAACVAAFEGYVGIDYGASALSLDYLLPTETSWLAGDRGYACLVFADSPLEGSVAGSAR